MSPKLTSTKKIKYDSVKVLVYGVPGIGKTRLCATAPDPLIISSEAGLISLNDSDIPCFEITHSSEIKEILEMMEKTDVKKYKTICLDSLTDIAETILLEYKSIFKDDRKAYGKTYDDVRDIIVRFRNLKNKHVYFSAYEEQKDIENVTYIYPGLPGGQLGIKVPHLLDEVFRYAEVPMKIKEEVKIVKALHTQETYNTKAKDRSGALNPVEKPNLSYIFEKILKNKKD